jgi:HSP20 family protein
MTKAELRQMLAEAVRNTRSGKLEANFKKGVLTGTLPKRAEAQKPAKKIDIKAAA